MLLGFLWSAQVSDVFVVCRPLLFLFRLQGLTHAVGDAVCLLFVASLDVTPLLVAVVAVVNVTLFAANVVVAVVIVNLLAGTKILYRPAPALTPTPALAAAALFFC